METYDDRVVETFLKQQLRLFPEAVAHTPAEAREFLEDVMAVVVSGKAEAAAFLEEEGMDPGPGEDPLDAAEVFPVGDGRYLIVEG